MNNHRKQYADLYDIDRGDLRTQQPPWTLLTLVLVAFAVSFVIGVYALATGVDEHADGQQVAEPGEPVATMALARAYRRGMADALAAAPACADALENRPRR